MPAENGTRSTRHGISAVWLACGFILGQNEESWWKKGAMLRSSLLSVCPSARGIFISAQNTGHGQVAPAPVPLSSSLLLAFACSGSGSDLVPQCYTAQINISYDGNAVWVCDKARQRRNEASWHRSHSPSLPLALSRPHCNNLEPVCRHPPASSGSVEI